MGACACPRWERKGRLGSTILIRNSYVSPNQTVGPLPPEGDASAWKENLRMRLRDEDRWIADAAALAWDHVLFCAGAWLRGAAKSERAPELERAMGREIPRNVLAVLGERAEPPESSTALDVLIGCLRKRLADEPEIFRRLSSESPTPIGSATEREAPGFLAASLLEAAGVSTVPAHHEAWASVIEEDPLIGRLLVRRFVEGSWSRRVLKKDFLSPLFLAALRSKQPEVAIEALKCCPFSIPADRKEEIRKEFERLFRGGEADVRLHVCLPLARHFRSREAAAHLLDVARGENPERVRTALYALGEIRYQQDVSPPGLVEALGELCSSEDERIRALAVRAFPPDLTGEMAQLLIERLADSSRDVVRTAKERLLQARNPRLAHEALQRAAETHANPLVRNAAKEILEGEGRRKW